MKELGIDIVAGAAAIVWLVLQRLCSWCCSASAAGAAGRCGAAAGQCSA